MKPIPKYLALLLIIIGFYACASTGSPDGGPYDEEPPKFVRATPAPNAINNTRKNVSIEFDEFINLENASEKVIISPPTARTTRSKNQRETGRGEVYRLTGGKYYVYHRLRRCHCRQ